MGRNQKKTSSNKNLRSFKNGGSIPSFSMGGSPGIPPELFQMIMKMASGKTDVNAGTPDYSQVDFADKVEMPTMNYGKITEMAGFKENFAPLTNALDKKSAERTAELTSNNSALTSPSMATPGFAPPSQGGQGGGMDYSKLFSSQGQQGGMDFSSILNGGGSGGGMDFSSILSGGGSSTASAGAGAAKGGLSGIFGAGGQGAGTAAGAGIFTAAGELGGQIIDKNTYSEDGIQNNFSAKAGGALRGAGKGAAIGSMVPGIGTAIGAVVGGTIGALTSKGNKEEMYAQRRKEGNDLIKVQNAANMGRSKSVLSLYKTEGVKVPGMYAKGGFVGPGDGKKLSDLTTHARNKAMKKWAHKYGLENDPERMKGESDKQYDLRNKMFAKKIREREDASYFHNKWGKVSDAVSNIENPVGQAVAEIPASLIEFPYQLSKSFMSRESKSQKFKNKEYLDTADAGLDASLLAMGIAPQYKTMQGLKGLLPWQQVAKRAPGEMLQERFVNDLQTANEKYAYGGVVGPDYQVEGGEVMVTPPGSAPMTDGAGRSKAIAQDTYKFEGDKHSASSGGIGVKGGEGGFVFSDQLTTDASKYLKGL